MAKNKRNTDPKAGENPPANPPASTPPSTPAESSAAASTPPAESTPPVEAKKEEPKPKPAKKDPAELLGSQLQSMMQDAASKFVKDNATDVAKLGEDVVRAIFAQQFMATMPAIMKLPENASVEMRIALEENNAIRTEIFQVIAKAEREDAARVARVRGNASSIVGKIAGGTITALAGFLGKAIIGL